MRSRFAAFVVGDQAYLLASWHPDTRPATLEPDQSITWTHLEILTASGGPFEREGTVHFRAHYRRDGERGVLEEHSTFVRDGGRWLYLDGVVS